MPALAHASVHRGGWVRRAGLSRTQAWATAFAFVIALTLAACAVGPNYFREPAPTPTAYKELKGFKLANPSDDVDRGDWWKVYRDRGLDELMPQVEVSNQTVAADAAAYEEARALIREAQAALLPTATASYNVTRTRTGPLAAAGGSSSGGRTPSGAIYSTTYTGTVTGGGSNGLGWEIDVWGKLRRQVESNIAEAQASAADLDNAKLSQQALLATAYFNMRAMDALRALLTHTIAEYRKTYNVVNNQLKAGYGPPGTTGGITKGDVAAAQAQILTAEGQFLNAGVQRAQYEHAIAVLIGRPPAELTIAPRGLSGGIPKIPVAVPSTLLERRPDIAASERTMQQENALIGVAEAAYFPDISVSSMVEYIGTIPLPLNAAHAIESIGAAGTQTLFNGGLTAAQVDAARATYWQSVANYRQTVLTAFQGVEDELAAIRLLSRQLAVDEEAARQERIAVDVYENQLARGLIAYTTVAPAQIILLADEEAALTARQDLFLASVTLIEDLGGGWDTTLLPDQVQLLKGFSLVPKLESTVPLPVELIPAPQTPSNPPTAPPPAAP